MTRILASLMLLAATAHAAGTFTPPATGKLVLKNIVGVGPAETRVPFPDIINLFRKTPLIGSFGDTQCHISIQPSRDDSWALVLHTKGAHRQEVAAAVPFKEMRVVKGGAKRTLGGLDYRINLDAGAIVFTTEQAPPAQLSLADIKTAVWRTGLSVPSLGTQWRVTAQRDLFIGAGMSSIVFHEAAQGGVNVYRVGTNGVDWTREVTREVGSRKVSLKFDEKNNLVIKPLP